MFQDRAHAAHLLAKRLAPYAGKKPLVLAIPRGGVPLGKIIADVIGGELDVALVHKLGHPRNQEYAIGSIDEEGNAHLDSSVLEDSVLLRSLEPIKQGQLARLKELRKQYTPLKKRLDPSNRIVILVDDGIATGWTVKAAITMLKRAKAKHIVVAAPVGPPDTIAELEALADEVVCLETPRSFHAVGQFYADFSQVTDEEVAEMLNQNP